MAVIPPALQPVANALAEAARAAQTLPELCFSVANDCHGFLGFQQALVFDRDERPGELLAVSGLAQFDQDSPYLIWLGQMWRWLQPRLTPQLQWLTLQQYAQDLSPPLLTGWQEWWPQGVLVAPLQRRDGAALGCACFLLNAEPSPEQQAVLQNLQGVWGYSWEMLGGQRRHRPAARLRQALRGRRKWLAVALGVLLLAPVRQSVLAPAEIVSLDAQVVAAPLDGVVKTVHVRPNQWVQAGQALFSLDDTTLRSRLEVSRKAVQVAQAQWLAATQKSFDQSQSKAELALLDGRVQERRAELRATEVQLARIDVSAPVDGVAVFADANDWLGKPVVTGERIMLLANPARPGVLIHLPVADALALDPGAPVKLYLTVQPLSPLSGRLVETSYQPTLSPDGVASYRLKAELDGLASASGASGNVRIGLRGTAKLSGDRVLLGYYLFRRPIAALREWSGW